MIIKPTMLSGVFEIENTIFKDHRGSFVKTFNTDVFLRHGLRTDFKENFYSISKQNVLRGMHFQLSPHDHAKLVYVPLGEILDVVVDIRRESATYGLCYATKISSSNAKTLYIDSGFAHGFLTLSESATVIYSTTSVHVSSHDTGIKWDSFSFDWGITNPIISERDSLFEELIMPPNFQTTPQTIIFNKNMEK